LKIPDPFTDLSIEFPLAIL
jgi:hypothetical protein